MCVEGRYIRRPSSWWMMIRPPGKCLRRWFNRPDTDLCSLPVASKHLVSKDVRVILLDLIMPEMDGFQLLRNLRSSKTMSGIPVLVLTGKDLTDEEKQLLKREARAFFQKGLNWQEDLLAEVRSVTSGS